MQWGIPFPDFPLCVWEVPTAVSKCFFRIWKDGGGSDRRRNRTARQFLDSFAAGFLLPDRSAKLAQSCSLFYRVYNPAPLDRSPFYLWLTSHSLTVSTPLFLPCKTSHSLTDQQEQLREHLIYRCVYATAESTSELALHDSGMIEHRGRSPPQNAAQSIFRCFVAALRCSSPFRFRNFTALRCSSLL